MPLIDRERLIDRARLRERARLARGLGGSLPAAIRGRANADTLLDTQADRRPDEVALAYLDQRITYRDLRERADQYARFFAEQGIGRGDRVVVDLDNRPDFLFVFHGLQRLGAVAALINTNLAGPPLAHVVRIAEPSLVVLGAEHAGALGPLLDAVDEVEPAQVFVVDDPEVGDVELPDGVRSLTDPVHQQSTSRLPPVEFEADDHCAYIYTSGTTGLPKAAVVPHLRFTSSGGLAGHAMHRVRPGELIYVTLPLYHTSALMLGWGAALSTGAGIALRRRFSASNFFADARTYDAVSALYIGELCRYLLNSPVEEGERDHSLRVITGNGMRPDVWEPFQERFGVPLVREFYGATEGTGMLINLAGRPGMVGRLPPLNVIIRCDPETGEPVRNADGFCEKVAPGETGLYLGAITKLVAFEGYRDREASAEKVLTGVFKEGDRYFNSGDLLQLHDRRWVSFVDRVGDTFRWKGENVSTNEVAEVLNGGPGVVEANVYGVEIPGTEGRAGMAQITVTDDFEPDALARFVGAELPSYQRPLFLRVAHTGIDVTGTFKHQKTEVRQQRFDPDRVDEPLYYLAGERYLPLDADVFAAIEAGEILPG